MAHFVIVGYSFDTEDEPSDGPGGGAIRKTANLLFVLIDTYIITYFLNFLNLISFFFLESST